MKKAGEEILCPFCGKESFLVKKVLMDGWKKQGETLVCSSCSHEIEKIDENLASLDSDATNKKVDKLKAFLDTENLEKKSIDAKSIEKTFCRDCKHYIHHPFLDKCGLHNKAVNPMDDCKDFKTHS